MHNDIFWIGRRASGNRGLSSMAGLEMPASLPARASSDLIHQPKTARLYHPAMLIILWQIDCFATMDAKNDLSVIVQLTSIDVDLFFAVRAFQFY